MSWKILQILEIGKRDLWVSSQWSTVLCLVAQLCLTVCDPMDCSPPGSSVHGTLQAGILEWVAIPSSRGSSQPRDQSQVSCTAGRFFTSGATKEAQEYWRGEPIPSPVDLPDPGIKLGSPEFQADSLPAELPGKPLNSKAVRNIVKILNFCKRGLALHLPAMHYWLLLSELQTSCVLSHPSASQTSGEVHPREQQRRQQ